MSPVADAEKTALSFYLQDVEAGTAPTSVFTRLTPAEARARASKAVEIASAVRPLVPDIESLRKSRDELETLSQELQAQINLAEGLGKRVPLELVATVKDIETKVANRDKEIDDALGKLRFYSDSFRLYRRLGQEAQRMESLGLREKSLELLAGEGHVYDILKRLEEMEKPLPPVPPVEKPRRFVPVEPRVVSVRVPVRVRQRPVDLPDAPACRCGMFSPEARHEMNEAIRLAYTSRARPWMRDRFATVDPGYKLGRMLRGRALMLPLAVGRPKGEVGVFTTDVWSRGEYGGMPSSGFVRGEVSGEAAALVRGVSEGEVGAEYGSRIHSSDALWMLMHKPSCYCKGGQVETDSTIIRGVTCYSYSGQLMAIHRGWASLFLLPELREFPKELARRLTEKIPAAVARRKSAKAKWVRARIKEHLTGDDWERWRLLRDTLYDWHNKLFPKLEANIPACQMTLEETVRPSLVVEKEKVPGTREKEEAEAED